MPAANTYWYFAYGSNMNPGRVRERRLPFDLVCPGCLPDHRLCFNKRSGIVPGAGHANVLAASGRVVEGVLYRLPDESSIEAMDPFERYPINYTRRLIEIQRPRIAGVLQDAAATALAWTYFATPGASTAPGEADLLPEPEYLDHLLAGEAFLSPEYVEHLRAQPVFATG